MKNKMHIAMANSLAKAKEELSKATYLEECGVNPGIQKINENKADWLKWIVYLAEIGFEAEKLLAEAETQEDSEKSRGCHECECASKDKLIADLTTINEQLRTQLTDMRSNLREEELCRKTLVNKAILDWFANLIHSAHDRCWLDGGDLVCSMDWLDGELAKLLNEVHNDH